MYLSRFRQSLLYTRQFTFRPSVPAEVKTKQIFRQNIAHHNVTWICNEFLNSVLVISYCSNTRLSTLPILSKYCIVIMRYLHAILRPGDLLVVKSFISGTIGTGNRHQHQTHMTRFPTLVMQPHWNFEIHKMTSLILASRPLNCKLHVGCPEQEKDRNAFDDKENI